MAKKIVGFIKLQVPAGKANPSPPIGPALGQRGLNIMEFCKAFNAQTQGVEPGLPLPVVITAFADKSFTFVIKTPPAAVLIMKALKLTKGSSIPNKTKVGKITRAQLEEIANTKMKDLNAASFLSPVSRQASPPEVLTTSAGFLNHFFAAVASCLDNWFTSNRWQGQRESNPQPSVLETDALPIELCPYVTINSD